MRLVLDIVFIVIGASILLSRKPREERLGRSVWITVIGFVLAVWSGFTETGRWDQYLNGLGTAAWLFLFFNYMGDWAELQEKKLRAEAQRQRLLKAWDHATSDESS